MDPQSSFRFFPEQASAVSSEIDMLYAFIWAVTGFFTLLIFALIVYLSLRYRRRSEAEVPRPTIESTRLELFYTFVPFAIVMVIFFWSAKVYFNIFAEPTEPIDVYVVGKQWMWKIQHPEGQREINELHVPVNRTVQLTMASQDVIHSFYIPAFRIKQDVVPGRYTKISFTPTRPGVYHLFCAEYCGTEHSRMVGRVYVMDEEKYNDWLSGAVPDVTPAAGGAELFRTKGCITCHGAQAPTLAGLFGRERDVLLPNGTRRTVIANEDYLREAILDSTATIVPDYDPIMPSFRGQVSEEQLMQLVAYIKSLRDAQVMPGTAAQQGGDEEGQGTGGSGPGAGAGRTDRAPAQPGPGSQKEAQD